MNQNTKGLKGEKSKEQLIACAARLFLEKGYNATGINEIISSAGLSKGSFYFYFSSKKDLAISVVEYYSQMKLTEVSETARNKTWEDFIEKLVDDILKTTKRGGNFGCPMAVLGMETAFLDPDIAAKNYASLKSMIGIFEDVLKRSGISQEKAAIGAERAFAIYEGYLLLYRLSKDICELEKILRDLKELYEHLK
ncbi:TetR/AcrR family transcriptional regulator [Sporomusa sp.]|uniref:TetR/AcrR family transcriptional regulator n=1 Tax=Sporomusa sp. TaxID=2078658 RepID=UPI002C2C4EB7|nr:TetR/AcrR family transcriptional regulator [Sporomusa sp.]HWR05602.1 TetR/AcrR family transcriptional regulator [Sporomusa sp.]